MNVWMIEQRLTPCVQNSNASNINTEMLFGDRFQRVSRSFEEDLVADLFIPQHQRTKLAGQREDHVEVGAIK